MAAIEEHVDDVLLPEACDSLIEVVTRAKSAGLLLAAPPSRLLLSSSAAAAVEAVATGAGENASLRNIDVAAGLECSLHSVSTPAAPAAMTSSAPIEHTLALVGIPPGVGSGAALDAALRQAAGAAVEAGFALLAVAKGPTVAVAAASMASSAGGAACCGREVAAWRGREVAAIALARTDAVAGWWAVLGPAGPPGNSTSSQQLAKPLSFRARASPSVSFQASTSRADASSQLRMVFPSLAPLLAANGDGASGAAAAASLAYIAAQTALAAPDASAVAAEGCGGSDNVSGAGCKPRLSLESIVADGLAALAAARPVAAGDAAGGARWLADWLDKRAGAVAPSSVTAATALAQESGSTVLKQFLSPLRVPLVPPPPSLILALGPPGCQKASVCASAAAAAGLVFISTGALLREAASATGGGAREAALAAVLNSGALADDHVVISLVRQALKAAASAASPGPARVLLEGFPRTPAQAAALDSTIIWDAVGDGVVDDGGAPLAPQLEGGPAPALVLVLVSNARRSERAARLLARGREDDAPAAVEARMARAGGAAAVALCDHYAALGLVRRVLLGDDGPGTSAGTASDAATDAAWRATAATEDGADKPTLCAWRSPALKLSRLPALLAPQTTWLLGGPGSGSRSAAAALASRGLGFAVLDARAQVIAAEAAGCTLGARLAAMHARGEPAPPGAIAELLARAMAARGALAARFLLCDTPRTAASAEAVTAALGSPQALILLRAPPATRAARVVGNAAVAARRIARYDLEMGPTLAAAAVEGRLAEVDATKTPDAVAAAVAAALLPEIVLAQPMTSNIDRGDCAAACGDRGIMGAWAAACEEADGTSGTTVLSSASLLHAELVRGPAASPAAARLRATIAAGEPAPASELRSLLVAAAARAMRGGAAGLRPAYRLVLEGFPAVASSTAGSYSDDGAEDDEDAIARREDERALVALLGQPAAVLVAKGGSPAGSQGGLLQDCEARGIVHEVEVAAVADNGDCARARYRSAALCAALQPSAAIVMAGSGAASAADVDAACARLALELGYVHLSAYALMHAAAKADAPASVDSSGGSEKEWRVTENDDADNARLALALRGAISTPLPRRRLLLSGFPSSAASAAALARRDIALASAVFGARTAASLAEAEDSCSTLTSLASSAGSLLLMLETPGAPLTADASTLTAQLGAKLVRAHKGGSAAAAAALRPHLASPLLLLTAGPGADARRLCARAAREFGIATVSLRTPMAAESSTRATALAATVATALLSKGGNSRGGRLSPVMLLHTASDNFGVWPRAQDMAVAAAAAPLCGGLRGAVALRRVATGGVAMCAARAKKVVAKAETEGVAEDALLAESPRTETAATASPKSELLSSYWKDSTRGGAGALPSKAEATAAMPELAATWQSRDAAPLAQYCAAQVPAGNSDCTRFMFLDDDGTESAADMLFASLRPLLYHVAGIRA